MPGPITAHGKAGEISTVPVAAKFLAGCFQSRNGYVIHGRLRPPVLLAALRQHHHDREAVTMLANGAPDTHLRLKDAVVRPFSRAVKKQNDRPSLAGRPILRDVNLVFVARALNNHGAIEKACLLLPGLETGSGWQDGKKNSDHETETSTHGLPPQALYHGMHRLELNRRTWPRLNFSASLC